MICSLLSFFAFVIITNSMSTFHFIFVGFLSLDKKLLSGAVHKFSRLAVMTLVLCTILLLILYFLKKAMEGRNKVERFKALFSSQIQICCMGLYVSILTLYALLVQVVPDLHRSMAVPFFLFPLIGLFHFGRYVFFSYQKA